MKIPFKIVSNQTKNPDKFKPKTQGVANPFVIFAESWLKPGLGIRMFVDIISITLLCSLPDTITTITYRSL